MRVEYVEAHFASSGGIAGVSLTVPDRHAIWTKKNPLEGVDVSIHDFLSRTRAGDCVPSKSSRSFDTCTRHVATCGDGPRGLSCRSAGGGLVWFSRDVQEGRTQVRDTARCSHVDFSWIALQYPGSRCVPSDSSRSNRTHLVRAASQ